MASSPHPMIHAERQALIDDLNGVEPARWNTPSLCPDWTVHQALGHLVSAAKMTTSRSSSRTSPRPGSSSTSSPRRESMPKPERLRP